MCPTKQASGKEPKLHRWQNGEINLSRGSSSPLARRTSSLFHAAAKSDCAEDSSVSHGIYFLKTFLCIKIHSITREIEVSDNEKHGIPKSFSSLRRLLLNKGWRRVCRVSGVSSICCMLMLMVVTGQKMGGGSRWVHVEVRVSSLSLNGELKFAFGDWTNFSRTPFTFYITHSFWREMHFCETLKASDTLLRVWALSVCDMHYYISVRITVTVSYTSYLIS